MIIVVLINLVIIIYIYQKYYSVQKTIKNKRINLKEIDPMMIRIYK